MNRQISTPGSNTHRAGGLLKPLIALVAFLCFFVFGSLPGRAASGPSAPSSRGDASEAETLATIGKDFRITAEDLRRRVENLPPEYKEMLQTEEGGDHLLMELLRIEVFSREAESLGMDKEDSFRRKVSEIAKALLAHEYTRRRIVSGIEVSDEEAERFFQEHPDEFKSPETIKTASILLKIPPGADAETIKEKESRAADLLRRIKQGEDFVAISRELSERSVKEEDEYYARGRLTPDIEEAVFSLKVGEVSPILRPTRSLVIFKMLDRIPEKTAAFEEVKYKAIELARSEKIERAFEEAERRLFEKYGVEVPKKSPRPPGE